MDSYTVILNRDAIDYLRDWLEHNKHNQAINEKPLYYIIKGIIENVDDFSLNP